RWPRAQSPTKLRCAHRWCSRVRPPLIWGWDGRALVLHRDAPERIILALRMAGPVIRHQDAGKGWMPVEDDAEHVVRLALVPVGCRVGRHHGGDVRIAVGRGDLEPDPHIPSV